MHGGGKALLSEELGSIGEVGLFLGLAHGRDDFAIVRGVEVQCIDVDSASRCEHTIRTSELFLIKTGVNKKIVLSLERIVPKVDNIRLSLSTLGREIVVVTEIVGSVWTEYPPVRG